MHFSIGKLKDIQKKMAKEAKIESAIELENIKTIAAFDMAFIGERIVCASAVFTYPELKLIEKRYLVKKASMNYIPSLLCFREGPLILESYYNLESDPDVLIIRGHGIAHPLRCGLATFVGVELAKPTIGIASKLLVGEVDDGKIILYDQEVGRAIKPTKYASNIYINPGNLISIDDAEKIVTGLIKPPHKMPEPLHIARKLANKMKKQLKEEKLESAGKIAEEITL